MNPKPRARSTRRGAHGTHHTWSCALASLYLHERPRVLALRTALLPRDWPPFDVGQCDLRVRTAGMGDLVQNYGGPTRGLRIENLEEATEPRSFTDSRRGAMCDCLVSLSLASSGGCAPAREHRTLSCRARRARAAVRAGSSCRSEHSAGACPLQLQLGIEETPGNEAGIERMSD